MTENQETKCVQKIERCAEKAGISPANLSGFVKKRLPKIPCSPPSAKKGCIFGILVTRSSDNENWICDFFTVLAINAQTGTKTERQLLQLRKETAQRNTTFFYAIIFLHYLTCMLTFKKKYVSRGGYDSTP